MNMFLTLLIVLGLKFSHSLFIIYYLQWLFFDILISHGYGSRIEVNSNLIARKSMKIIKRYQKISHENSSL